MDTSAGDKSRRSESISHIVPFESPSCQRTSKSDNKEPATIAPRDGTQSYAFNHETRNRRQEERENRHHMSAQSRQQGTNIINIPSSDQTQQEHAQQLSQMDLVYDTYQLLDQISGSDDLDLVDPFQRASLVPPVTHDSLAELDIARIINNPKLRHDVNFDRELHFRPNLDGSRGRTKLKAADEYWKALIGELELYRAIGMRLIACQTPQDQEYWTKMMQTSQKRLPGMFETIREVIKTLVPDRDQARVNERLDISMIMQEISKGVFDLMDLAQWLAKLLKAHCAPMRDEWIDQMVAQTQRGVDEGCQKRIVLGLRQLLGILESMKLDVANHQIRHLRGLLIEDAVNFQQKYHVHRMSYGRFDLARARRWFEKEQQMRFYEPTPAGMLHTFTSAFLRSIVSNGSIASSHHSVFPDTFQLDSERLRALRSDIYHAIYLDICCEVFDMLASRKLSEQARESAKCSLRSALTDIVGESRRFAENVGNIAAEVVRSVLHLEGSTNSYDINLLDFAEQRLQADLHPSSIAFGTRTKSLTDGQLPRFHESVEAHLRMSMIALHETMIPPTTVAPPFTLGMEAKPDLEQQSLDGILRRLTHVAVLHWHIWSPIAYNNPDFATSRSPSPASSSRRASDDESMSLGISQDDAMHSVEGRAQISPSPNPEAAGEVSSYSNHPSGPSVFNEPRSE